MKNPRLWNSISVCGLVGGLCSSGCIYDSNCEKYSGQFGISCPEESTTSTASSTGDTTDGNTTDGMTTLVDTGMTTTVDMETTADSGPPMTTGEPCMDDGDCGVPTEFCGPEGNCVNCAGVPSGRCGELFPDRPICSNGQCIQCNETDSTQCVDTAPVCNVGEQMCEACDEHADCGDAACNFFNGECLDDAVVYVGPGPGAQPNLASAFSAVMGQDKATIVVQEPVAAELDIASNIRLGIIAEGGRHLWDDAPGDAPQLRLSGGGTVIVEGFRIADNSDLMVPAVDIASGSAWFDRTQISENNGGAIRTANADALVLRNCFVHAENGLIGLEVNGTGTVEVVYTTIGVEFGAAIGLSCAAPDTVNVRNSIVIAQTDMPEIVCDGLTIENSATESDYGGSNTSVGDIEAVSGWMTWFDAAQTGNFHIAGAGLDTFSIGQAQWQDGDPVVDIDGDPRPKGGGAADRPGADVP